MATIILYLIIIFGWINQENFHNHKPTTQTEQKVCIDGGWEEADTK